MLSNLIISLLSHMPINGHGLLFVVLLGGVTYPVAKILFFILKIKSNLKKEQEAKMRALDKRRAPSSTPQVFVRQTDILEKMSKEDQSQYNLSMQLIEKKQIIEAATILESIKFQRKAIDILEKAGHIEEAAQMLIRLSAPNRAAVLYERNNILDKALAIYLKLEMYKEAGFIYLKLGKNDFRYVYKSAQCFERACLLKEALDSYMLVSAYKEAFALAPQLFDHEVLLQNYMRDRVVAQYFFSTSSLETIEGFIKKLNFLPLVVNSLTEWIRLAPGKLPYSYIFPELLNCKGLFAYLMHRSDPFLKKIILQEIFLLSELLVKHADTISYDLENCACIGESVISSLVFEKSDKAFNSLCKLNHLGQLSDTLHQFPLFKDIIIAVPAIHDEITVRKWLEEVQKDVLTAVQQKKSWSEIEKKTARVGNSHKNAA